MNKKKKSIQETQNRIRRKIINETEEEDKKKGFVKPNKIETPLCCI